MIQELYQQAIKFAGEKHKNQLVPGTESNYLLHLSNVCMEVLMAYQHEGTFSLELAVPLALLHDTLEDTDTTYKEIVDQFGEKVAQGIRALSKNTQLPSKQEQMQDSLKRIHQTYKEVALVKMADRITNLQQPPAYWTQSKIKAYWEEAMLIHQQLSGSHHYLAKRFAKTIKEYEKYLP